MKDKVVAIIQARMGSSRLPGKIMMDLAGKTVLEHVILRVKQAKLIDDIVIATTNLDSDDIVVELAQKLGTEFFRGSEDDVLSRYYQAAVQGGATTIVRITSDCPLIDPRVIDEVINFYNNNSFEIVTNAGNDTEQRTYPRGLDVEATSFKALEEAYYSAKDKYQREHVTPYIYEHARTVGYYKNKVNCSEHRWTLDTPDDYKLINSVYNSLYKGEHNFYFEDILNLVQKNPDIALMNNHIKQKGLKA